MHHGGAFNYSISLAGQAGEGGTDAAKTIRKAFAAFLTALDDANIPAGGTLTGNVAPVIDPADNTAKGGEVLHDVAADVLAAAKVEVEKAKQRKAKTKAAADAENLTKAELRDKLDKLGADQPPSDATKAELEKAVTKAEKK